MVCAGLQLIGFILGVISWIGMIATCASPEWRRNSRGNTIIDMSIRYEGLWTKCSLFVTGQTKCTPYDSFFVGVPSVLQVCRALMIASLVLGLFAILITIFGVRCTSIGNSNPQAKARAAIVGGILFIVAAVLVGVAVSYYSHEEVVQEFYNPVIDKLPVHAQYEYGLALFFGWASLVAGGLGGGIICFSSIHVLKKVNAQRLRLGPRIQRHQHLPLAHHSRHTTTATRQANHGQPSLLTKQRMAQHNAKLNARNGHHNHVHAYTNHHCHVHRPHVEAKSSKDRGHAESKQIGPIDHLEGSSRHHQQRHRSENSKSRAKLLQSSSREGDLDGDKKDVDSKDDNSSGRARKRPANEYV